MKKHLLIMRHAKSSWSEPGLTDHQRPLNKRGRRDAPQMGQWVASQGCVPERILSSTAKRALETAQSFIEYCDGVELDELETVDAFYHGHPNDYFDTLSQLDANCDIVMVVGHNPGLEELVIQLGGHYERMPTAAIAHFELAIESWMQIEPTPSATLLDIWRPKEIF